jgi:hypothetical protein
MRARASHGSGGSGFLVGSHDLDDAALVCGRASAAGTKALSAETRTSFRDSDLLLEEEVSAALIPGFLPAAEAGAAGPLVASLP